jgi:F0F1-type ATP synthase membrane subunit b/b'
VAFLVFLALIIYWRYSSSSSKSGRKGSFQSAGEHVDSVVEGAKHKMHDAVDDAKDKVNDAVEGAKDKARKLADNVEHAAADAKKKL